MPHITGLQEKTQSSLCCHAAVADLQLLAPTCTDQVCKEIGAVETMALRKWGLDMDTEVAILHVA